MHALLSRAALRRVHEDTDPPDDEAPISSFAWQPAWIIGSAAILLQHASRSVHQIAARRRKPYRRDTVLCLPDCRPSLPIVQLFALPQEILQQKRPGISSFHSSSPIVTSSGRCTYLLYIDRPFFGSLASTKHSTARNTNPGLPLRSPTLSSATA